MNNIPLGFNCDGVYTGGLPGLLLTDHEMKHELDKRDITRTLLFFDRFFPFISGDLPDRNEKAEKAAEEMLDYEDHKLWDKVEEYFPMLPDVPRLSK